MSANVQCPNPACALTLSVSSASPGQRFRCPACRQTFEAPAEQGAITEAGRFWPQATEYNAAIQNPATCFSDPELRQGQPAADLFGLPRPHSGGSADVYQIEGPNGQSWAVKCFTREVRGLYKRYQAISEHLRHSRRAFLVDFQYLDEGIRLGGRWHPLLKMRWVEGLRLNEFVAEQLDRPTLLDKLAQMWLKLAQELRRAGIAHGDLQHGNVLLTPGGKNSSLALRLVDYDGLCVPALAGQPSGEVGHPNYQHPQRLRDGAYGAEMDRFAQLAIYTALRCLAVGGPALWQRFDTQENLLFREADFRQPEGSPVWRDLFALEDAEVRALVSHLFLASQGPIERVPLLEELVAAGSVRPLRPAEEEKVRPVASAGKRVTGDGLLRPSGRPGKAVPQEDAGDLPEALKHFCTLLARSRLLAGKNIWLLPQRWRAETGDSRGGAAEFARWLTANHFLTSYQAGILLRGRADRFYLNEYKLLERIGQGRMAGVFRAVHRLGQIVAIKVLPPSKARDPQVFARFQREARLAVRLNHRNVVRTFQTGEAMGLHYLVMECLEGETLEEVLQRRQRLPPVEAARLIHQALCGLECLHAARIVHRDLKPANLMVIPARVAGKPDTDLHATVKVLDIGLGRVLFDEEAVDPDGQVTVTAPGEVLGSPDYMAPEQATDSHAVDHRADIYSLGCVLYHAVAGQPPFPGRNPLKKILRHASEVPRSIKDFSPAAPDWLEQVLTSMMAKDPSQRYATPEQAAQALQACLSEQAVVPRLEADPQMQEFLQWLESSGTIAKPNNVFAAIVEGVAEGQPTATASAQGTTRRLPPPLPPPLPVGKAASRFALSRRRLLAAGAGIVAFAFLLALAALFRWLATR